MTLPSPGYSLSSPSLAEGLIQVCLDGVEEVCGVDVMLVQLDTEKARQDRGDQENREHTLKNKTIKPQTPIIIICSVH